MAPNGKPITSLALKLEGEGKAEEDGDNKSYDIEKIAKINTYTDALEEALLDADGRILNASDAARGMRAWLQQNEYPSPTVEALRKHFLYAVRDATEKDPHYVAAYLIHGRNRLRFSHPERVAGIKRAPKQRN